MTASRVVGYVYDGTITNLPRVERILQRAAETGIVTQFAVKQYGRRGEGTDRVWFNGAPGSKLRQVRNEVRALVQPVTGR